MKHQLMDLPFEENAFEPVISKETIQYHHGKHHAGYVNKLNLLIEGTKFEDLDLAKIVVSSEGGIFNNGAQVYNHNFYFNGLSTDSGEPSKELLELINRDFESLELFKKKFLETGAGLFGSGWVWLSVDEGGVLHIESHSNASNPLLNKHTPLITCDVWEHAYYIDYRNVRADYLNKWWDLINWDFVSQNLEAFNESRHGFVDPCNENSDLCEYIDAIERMENTST